VAANGWIEGLTVTSIILGTVLGGALVNPHIAHYIIARTPAAIHTSADAAMLVIMGIYIIAALINLGIPDTGARYRRQQRNPIRLVTDFAGCFVTLWSDRLGQISLAVTTLFWGAGATLQFIVLKWAEKALDMNLSEGAILQAVSALGVAIGAMLAAAKIPLKKSLSVLPVGIAMGIVVMGMAFFSKHTLPDWPIKIGIWHVPFYLIVAYLFLILVGGLAGFFVVPMNALLQHRGHVLLSAGHSIAVQNFNENLSVLLMLCLYALLIWFNVPVGVVIVLFGTFVCCTMWLVMRRHQANQRQFDAVALIGEIKH
ncbi:MAG: lysophospholipid transporter LplT, partial [Burkholderiales bacterium]|nr:lysophospholipid transporter LplT [Burkholderiales bacterium]MDE2611305.1 lysophospholipid transporter LplT [Burkholderiales bacterium]